MIFKKKIVLLTGNELRHVFFRKAIALSDKVEVLLTMCEDTQLSLSNRVCLLDDEKERNIMLKHIQERETAEQDFFLPFVKLTPDYSNPYIIHKGDINSSENIERILSLHPDFILVYGSSLLKGKLIDEYGVGHRIINLHLGLSPYYRGSGTNFWALVNKEPECFGATFMFLDEGIDTGNIIHQIRPTIYENDTPHTLGNRLIADAVFSYIDVLENLKSITPVLSNSLKGNLYKRGQFSFEAVLKLYQNFSSGMLKKYIKNKKQRDLLFPIISLNENEKN